MSRNQVQAKPLFSVIIPLYNKAPYIKQTIESVLSQTIQDFEIIIVGGNSTDGGENIVLEYADQRILLIQEEHVGVSAARNQGMDMAKGELIAFLDADDEWLPEYLETILNLRQKYPEAGLYTTGWYRCCCGIRHERRCYGIPENYEGIIPSVFKIAALGDGAVFPGYTSSTVIPKSVLSKVGTFRVDATGSEDLDLWARIALFYSNAHSQKHLVLYNLDDENSASKNFQNYSDAKSPFEVSLEEMQESGVYIESQYPSDLKIYLESLKIMRASWLIRVNQRKEARTLLKTIHCKVLMGKVRLFWLGSFVPKWAIPTAISIYRKLF